MRRDRDYEHLDRVIHHFVDRVAWWIHRFSRRFRTDSLAVGVRDYLSYFAFCYGEKGRLNGPFASCRATGG